VVLHRPDVSLLTIVVSKRQCHGALCLNALLGQTVEWSFAETVKPRLLAILPKWSSLTQSRSLADSLGLLE
jgi:hypothetical protein